MKWAVEKRQCTPHQTLVALSPCAVVQYITLTLVSDLGVPLKYTSDVMASPMTTVWVVETA